MPLINDRTLWWNLPGVLLAYQPVRGPNALLARYNMARGGDNRYRATPGTAPTWAPATGWTFAAASSQWLDTGLAQGGTEWSWAIRFVTPTQDSGYVFGSYSNDNVMTGLRPNPSATQLVWANASQYRTHPGGARATSGVAIISGRLLYLDGVYADTKEVASAPAPTIAIGDLHGASIYALGSVQAFAAFSRALSASEVWAVTQQMKYCDANPEWSVWTPSRKWWQVGVAGGGTVYTQSAAGAQTNTGAIAKRTATTKAGDQTNTGALIRQAAKPVAGALTSAGALIRQTAKVVAGAQTNTGALATLRTAYAVLTGAMENVGALVRQTNKAASGAWEGAGTLARQVGKILAGAWEGVGDLVGTFISGGGTLYYQVAAGAWEGAGTLARGTNKALAGAWSGAGTLARQAGKLMTGAWSGAGAIVRRTAKAFAGAWSGSGSLAELRAKFLGGAWSGSGALTRATSKGLAGAWSGLGAIARRIAKAIGGAWSGIGALARVWQSLVTALIDLTLHARSTSVTLEDRETTLTVHDR